MCQKLFCLVLLFLNSGWLLAQSSLAQTSVANYLPKETIFLSVASNPEMVLQKLGYSHLIQKYQAYYDMAVNEIMNVTGHNFLDVATLKNIGVDLNKGAGFTFIEPKLETFALFFTLSNRDQVQSTISEIAQKNGGTLNFEAVGNVTFLYPTENADAIFMFRDQYLFVFGGGSYHFQEENKGLNYVKTLAQITVENSLGSDSNYNQAVAGLSFGKDGAAYFNFPALIQSIVDESANAEPYVSYLRQEIQYLRESGATEEEIANIERQAAEDEAWYAESRKRDQENMQQLQNIFSSVKGIVFGAELGATSVQVKCHVELAPDSFFSQFLQNFKNPTVFLQCVDKRPNILLNGQIKLASIINLFAELNPSEMNSVKQGLQQEMQIDLEEDIFNAFTGEMGFALTGAISVEGSEPNPMNLDFYAAIQLTNPAKFFEMIKKICSRPELAEAIQMDEMGKITINIPEWKPVYLMVCNNYFTASSDASFAPKMVSGYNNSSINQYKNVELQNLLKTPEVAAVGVLDFSFFAALGMRSYYDFYEEGYSEEIDSEEYRKIQEELKEIKAQLRESYKKSREEENKALTVIFSHIGDTAAIAKIESSRIVVQGGQFVNLSSLAEFIGAMIDSFMKMEQNREAGYQEREPLETRRWQLEDRLYQLRSGETTEEHAEHTEEEMKEEEKEE